MFSISLIKGFQERKMSQSSLFHEEMSCLSNLDSSGASEERELNDQFLEGLHQSRGHVVEFIQSLKERSESPIKDMMFNFCGQYREFQLSPKNVMVLLEKRIQRMAKNRKRKKNWNGQDSKVLIWIVSKFMEHRQIQQIQSLTIQDWKNISKLIPGSLPESCMFKILNLRRTKLSENKWTPEQSAILEELVMKDKKKNWRRISQKLYLAYENQHKMYRNAKQCKERWNCFLDPELKKGSWDISEDKVLFSYLLNNQGQKRWSNLTKIIKGRTENALKNRYNIVMERQSQKYDSKDEVTLVSNYLKKLKLGLHRNTFLYRKKLSKKYKKTTYHEPQQEKIIKKKDLIEEKNELKVENNGERSYQMKGINKQEGGEYFMNGQCFYPIMFPNQSFFYFNPSSWI